MRRLNKLLEQDEFPFFLEDAGATLETINEAISKLEGLVSEVGDTPGIGGVKKALGALDKAAGDLNAALETMEATKGEGE